MISHLNQNDTILFFFACKSILYLPYMCVYYLTISLNPDKELPVYNVAEK